MWRVIGQKADQPKPMTTLWDRIYPGRVQYIHSIFVAQNAAFPDKSAPTAATARG